MKAFLSLLLALPLAAQITPIINTNGVFLLPTTISVSNLPANSLMSAGVVAPGTNYPSMVWGTDTNGTPGWVIGNAAGIWTNSGDIVYVPALTNIPYSFTTNGTLLMGPYSVSSNAVNTLYRGQYIYTDYEEGLKNRSEMAVKAGSWDAYSQTIWESGFSADDMPYSRLEFYAQNTNVDTAEIHIESSVLLGGPTMWFAWTNGYTFYVEPSGNLATIREVNYEWPTNNVQGILANDGSGNLEWSPLKTYGTNWLDSMVPSLSVQVGATAPSLQNFIDANGKVYMFANNRDDTVYFTVQLNHNYKEGSTVYPHVHWTRTAATGAGTNVVWQWSYTWANPVTQEFPSWQSITVTNAVAGTNWWHQIASMPSISGSGKKASSIMAVTLKRLASSADADDYDQSCAFIGADVHYQVDSIGSPLELGGK